MPGAERRRHAPAQATTPTPLRKSPHHDIPQAHAGRSSEPSPWQRQRRPPLGRRGARVAHAVSSREPPPVTLAAATAAAAGSEPAQPLARAAAETSQRRLNAAAKALFHPQQRTRKSALSGPIIEKSQRRPTAAARALYHHAEDSKEHPRCRYPMARNPPQPASSRPQGRRGTPVLTQPHRTLARTRRHWRRTPPLRLGKNPYNARVGYRD